jgi:hypothetical protein
MSEMESVKPDVVYGQIVHDGTLDDTRTVVANPTHVRRSVSVGERTRRAIALKLAGASYAAIAEQLGYANSGSAHKAVQRGLKFALQESAGELRKIHYGRLEHMLMLVWPDVNRKDLSSMQMALGIMDRMERLFGLNAAERIEVSASRETVILADGNKEDYIKALQEAGERLSPKALQAVADDDDDEDLD